LLHRALVARQRGLRAASVLPKIGIEDRDAPLGGESCCGAFRRPFYGPPASALVVPAADIYRGCRMRTRCFSVAVENLPAVHPLLAHRVTSMRCGILLVLAHSGSRVSVRENTPRSVFRQLITYATSRSLVSSALAFGARRFSSETMVAPMFSLLALRLRASRHPCAYPLRTKGSIC
jgi:hypothetical protein